MSKLKLALAPKHSYVIDTKPVGEMFHGRFGLIRNLLAGGAILYLVLSILLLGVTVIGYDKVDSALMAGLLNMVVVLSAAWLGLMLLCGWAFIVDPPLFVPILVFALLVTASYLLSPTLSNQGGNPANTFGISGAKMISVAGLSASIFAYYFINVFVNTAARLRAFFLGLIWGVVLLAIMATIGAEANIVTLSSQAELDASKYLLMMVPSIFFFLLLGKNNNWGFWAAVVGIVLNFYVALNAPLAMWVWIIGAVIGIAVLVVLATMTGFSISESFKTLRKSTVQALSGQASVASVFLNSPVLSLAALFIIYLIVMVVAFVGAKLQFATEASKLASDYQLAFAGITDVRTLLFGGGAVSNRVTAGLADIIAYNGLLGLVAYLLLWGSVIRLALQRMLIGLTEKSPRYEVVVLLPILLGLPLLGIFTAVPALGWWVWWLAVGYLTADLLITKRKPRSDLLPTWKWRQNLTLIAPIVQIIGIVVIIVAASALTRVITDLFTQATI